MDSSFTGRLVHGMAKAIAIAGGIVLAALIIITVVSVVGRVLIPLGLGPIQGDYEMVQGGVLFAIFCFLPWCQLTNGHAVVGIFTDNLPPRLSAAIVLVTDIGMLGLAVFIGWRHLIGTLDKFGNGETTFILRLPLWWFYASGLLGAAAFVLVAAYCVVRSTANTLSAHPQLPVSGLAE